MMSTIFRSMSIGWVDLFIPKWMVKTVIFMMTGRLPLRVGIRRLLLVFRGRFNGLGEVMAVDRELGIPSTFFVGMRNGLGMSYSRTWPRRPSGGFRGKASPWAFTAWRSPTARLMGEEYARFTAIVGAEQPFGVRNHYLRRCSQTPLLQKAVGYLYDSSEYGLKPPYEAHGMIEFPVCLMDSYVLGEGRNDLEDVKRKTLAAFAEAGAAGLDVLHPHFS